jgi:hypothetical protein
MGQRDERGDVVTGEGAIGEGRNNDDKETFLARPDAVLAHCPSAHRMPSCRCTEGTGLGLCRKGRGRD